MAKQKEVKTNAMRILESLKIPYTHHTYECEEFVDGLQIADKLSLPYEQVYREQQQELFCIRYPYCGRAGSEKGSEIGRGKERGNDPRKGH